jgi:hypothetical protein
MTWSHRSTRGSPNTGIPVVGDAMGREIAAMAMMKSILKKF